MSLRLHDDIGNAVPVGFETIRDSDCAGLQFLAPGQYRRHAGGLIDGRHPLELFQHGKFAVPRVEARNAHCGHPVADRRDAGMQARGYHRFSPADDLREKFRSGPFRTGSVAA